MHRVHKHNFLGVMLKKAARQEARMPLINHRAIIISAVVWLNKPQTNYRLQAVQEQLIHMQIVRSGLELVDPQTDKKN